MGVREDIVGYKEECFDFVGFIGVKRGTGQRKGVGWEKRRVTKREREREDGLGWLFTYP